MLRWEENQHWPPFNSTGNVLAANGNPEGATSQLSGHAKTGELLDAFHARGIAARCRMIVYIMPSRKDGCCSAHFFATL